MRSLKNLGGRVIPGRFRFHEPDPSRTFDSLDKLVAFVREYRESNQIEQVGDLREEIEDWICHNIGSPEYYCREDGQPIVVANLEGRTAHDTGYQGQAKWKEFHEWTVSNQITDDAEREQWLKDFAASLPCGECRRGWRKIVKDNPPPPAKEGNFPLFLWGVERHNDVRRKLGQEEFPLGSALELYGGLDQSDSEIFEDLGPEAPAAEPEPKKKRRRKSAEPKLEAAE